MNNKNIKINFFTFGCRLNRSETGSLKYNFTKKGFTLVPTIQEADIIVLNTCTVTEKGSLDTYRYIKKIIKISPSIQIAVIGCLAELEKEKLLKINNVKWVVGNADKMNLIDLLSKHHQERTFISKIKRKSFTIESPSLDKDLTRANLKIHDGCDSFCSYCIIPFTRGPSRSRELNNLLDEAELMISSGYKEIVLTGINIGNYQYDNNNITNVLEKIIAIKGDFRIRISSIEPGNILNEIISLMKHNSKICRFLHIPVQSCNDIILKKMGRNYLRESFKDVILKAFNEIPGICLGTDIITGFPGETEELFNDTYNFLTKLPLSYFHVFSYSKRPLAKSTLSKNIIPQEIIKNRSKKLRELSNNKKNQYLKNFINTTQNVLFENNKHGLWSGLTDNFIRVKVSSTSNLTNKNILIHLKQIQNRSFTGEIRPL